ncbi:zf-TFIIB domain-containing protein [Prosthecobacter vanneervenii]|uniref:Transcription elongation factor Elf1 n=1 Tax=Prosthecobacter vanneervenii TaxID=48466 RepID=A0A7W7YEF8_9BACT|nr:zf-TFIIB domain-containing protein [Prosthecobacter vanneervenii]MBB5034678.1 transcription elongation factor Elf1 [Prosthecobacter vanneervenii]
MNMFPMQCPRCRQGHDLHAIRVDGIKTTLFVCHECDATWTSIEAIGALPPEDFESYLGQKGIDPIRAYSEVIDAKMNSYGNR